MNVCVKQRLKPDALALQNDGNFTRIYLGKTLIFVVYYYSEERSENREDFLQRGGYYITELGLANIVIRQDMKKRRFRKQNGAIRFCLAALKCFRIRLNEELTSFSFG